MAKQKGNKAANENLDRISREVEEATTVQGSAAALINGIGAELKAVKAELANIGVDNERLNALSDSLDQSSNDLAAAILANTPSEGESPEV